MSSDGGVVSPEPGGQKKEELFDFSDDVRCFAGSDLRESA